MYAGKQGAYFLVNPKKSLNNLQTFNNRPFIKYRSALEADIMRFLDYDKNVVKWGYELVIIPYINIEGKKSKYVVDFVVYLVGDRVELWEGKPLNIAEHKTTDPLLQRECDNNDLKWDAARNFSNANGFVFRVVGR